MEEDLKILEEHLSFIKNFDNGSKYIPALENLIKRYKELEADNYECNNIISEQIQIINDSIPKSKIQEIRDKAEVMDYYTLPNVIDDLNELLESEEYNEGRNKKER